MEFPNANPEILGDNFEDCPPKAEAIIHSLRAFIPTIPESLLATLDMQVTGKGSYHYFYNWY